MVLSLVSLSALFPLFSPLLSCSPVIARSFLCFSLLNTRCCLHVKDSHKQILELWNKPLIDLLDESYPVREHVYLGTWIMAHNRLFQGSSTRIISYISPMAICQSMFGNTTIVFANRPIFMCNDTIFPLKKSMNVKTTIVSLINQHFKIQ